MIIVSDNVATAMVLLEMGGPDAVIETATELGLTTARLASSEEMWAGKPYGTSLAPPR